MPTRFVRVPTRDSCRTRQDGRPQIFRIRIRDAVFAQTSQAEVERGSRHVSLDEAVDLERARVHGRDGEFGTRVDRGENGVGFGEATEVVERSVELNFEFGDERFVRRLVTSCERECRSREPLRRVVVGEDTRVRRRVFEECDRPFRLAIARDLFDRRVILLCGDDAIAPDGRETIRDFEMDAPTDVRFESPVCGLLHAIVPEANRIDRTLRAQDETVCERRCDASFECGRREAGRRGDEFDRHVVADARDRFEEPRARRWERGDARAQEIDDVSATDVREDVRRVPRPAVLAGHERAVVAEGVDELDRVVGVALRSGADDRREFGRALR